jgi:UMF1 family MFS transporter
MAPSASDDKHRLTDAARQRSRLGLISWALYDWANSAFPTVIQTFVFAAYFTRQVAANEAVGSMLWGTMLGVAGTFVAVGGPILGAIADQGGRRKPWIAVTSLVCIIATALLWFVKPSPDYVWLALILVGLGTLGVEFAVIFYNAMLSRLAPPRRLGRWSGWGWGVGYAGGLACLVLALVPFMLADHPWFGFDQTSAEHVRVTFLIVAVWYFVFALPLFLFTPDQRGTGKGLSQATRDGLRQLRDTIREARRYGPIVRFLIARMIYINGLATLFAFGGVYAAGTFAMTERDILLFGIALNLTAGLGAFAFAWVDDWIGSKRTILLSLAGLFVPATIILLVESPAWFWALGMILGVFTGPAQAAGRTFLARIAPERLQNELFGLEALSGKATAFLGPLLVGWVTYWTGSQRLGMSTILAFFAAGFVLMLTVRERRTGFRSCP